MKKNYLYIVALTLLAACSSNEEQVAPNPDSGNGAIQLSAGIVEGGQQSVTRAGENPETGESGAHSTHLALTPGTKLALRVSGTWTGHSPSADIIYTTTGTVGSTAGTDNLHNAVSCDPVLYWDDYGTADPANTNSGTSDPSKGREIGLTIYGAAIDNYKDGDNFAISSDLSSISSVTDITNWTALSWELAADQTTSGYIASKDLLISNNVSSLTSSDYSANKLDCGTYKFDDFKNNIGKLLEFHHAMSKITVNLKAGAGFNDTFTSTTVTLTSNKTGESNDEWAYTTGTVDVTSGTVSSQNNLAVITMADAASVTADYHATKEALVMPGSQFTSDDAVIAKIVADGNIYYIDAEKIRTKINSSTHATDGAYSTEAGKNYILNVTVNKTDIVVTATITNWVPVEAASVSPVINVSGDYGTPGAGTTTNSFSFFRSTALNNGYSAELTTPTENGYYKPSSTVSYSSGWTMSPTLYWPDHQTHYQFRGVYPTTVTTSGEGVLSSPRVEAATHDAVEYQVIKVKNVAYSAGSFPSDLAIARPEIDAATLCKSNEHEKVSLYNVGICATEGTITMNFLYMMSQVEVNLSTSAGSDAVTLTNAVVEVENIYSEGDVTLGSREVLTTNYYTGSYTLDKVSSDASHCLSAIVPQTLTYGDAMASTNVRFKITITNTGTPTTTDVYYCDVAPIKKEGESTLVAPNGAWESGVHYIYNLYLTKTQIKVTATLANWTTVTANPDVWF